jgi:hypothetical protein
VGRAGGFALYHDHTIACGGGVQQVNCLQIAPDKSVIAAAGNPQIKLYDIASSHAEPVGAAV